MATANENNTKLSYDILHTMYIFNGSTSVKQYLVSCECNWSPSNIITCINICTRCNKILNALQVITADSLEQWRHALAVLAF